MPLRCPPSALDPKQATTSETAWIHWKEYVCELVTPLYGGGVEAGKVDKGMPVRAGAIRGQLRFWWRLLARHKWRLENIKGREFNLWGGLNNKNVYASRVWIRVEDISSPDVEAWAKFEQRNGRWQSIPTPKPWANVPYALFPAQGKRPGGPDAQDPALLAKPGLRWKLHVGFEQRHDDTSSEIQDEMQAQVDETLRWWASFGGIGARTRRGLGAIRVESLRAVGQEETEAASCQLVLRGASNAETAWKNAVDKLRDFRQKPGFARNAGNGNRPGRSLWPEPDAIRRLAGQHAPNHAPAHAAGNVFPRAAFGLPIIFQFKDNNDPADHALQAQGYDRLASPLILRPYTNGQNWFAAALLLPHSHVENMNLELKRGGVTIPEAIPYWQTKKASLVPPIAQASTKAQDALSAFLEFFQR
ncbi:MAG: type III-B CRISPR module RAMP protein Cmr1 [Zoogloeaceae bacterium]|jgi:CRISPR-associated protein Cmr1|nr:type III-B CRISPR module RAMP protein Cmr1 [Zoogloeaceae bacterium]